MRVLLRSVRPVNPVLHPGAQQCGPPVPSIVGRASGLVGPRSTATVTQSAHVSEPP